MDPRCRQDGLVGRYRPIFANARDSNVDEDAMSEHRRNKTDPYGPNAQLTVAAVNGLPALLDLLEQYRAALTKISAIRDSIVGMQGFNFSEHAYPLVAALGEAGFKGAGYEIARKNLGTLIEQIKACEAERDALKADNQRMRAGLQKIGSARVAFDAHPVFERHGITRKKRLS